MAEKYLGNSDESNDCLDITKMKELFDNEKISDVSDVPDTLKEVQWKMVDGGDGLKLNCENEIQLKTIEKELERLKIQNEFITNKVHSITNRSKFENDQITTIKVETNKIQNEMEKIHDKKIEKELENAICFKTIIDKMVGIHSHIDQFKVIVNGLETTIEEIFENKKTIAEIMELCEYMKNQYYLQITENQRQFTEKTSKHVDEINQLNAYVDIKTKEVNDLEKRCIDQQLCIDFHQKLLKRVEKYIADMLSTIFLYTKQSENEKSQLLVPNENQKEIVSILAKKLEEIRAIVGNERISRHDD
ncbi:uncharacterized protein LOC112592914 [Melanaphis sacchari]|uniref:uncharacterized protein LOC112592914 n=1 Tax=Melanaphis sacchari TaxID=742174 RepID=UPI000DC13D04|nr:uncharacterized protein LOC112592914 [Melanaphis sacchari]